MKNILGIIGLIIAVLGTNYNDVPSTILGLLVIFINLSIKINDFGDRIEDLNTRLDNYKDIIKLNKEVEDIKKRISVWK